MARRAGRVLVAITTCLTALGAWGVAPRPAGATLAPGSVPPNAWIVVDARTGEVLESGHDHLALHPASITKIMTAITAVERVPPDATMRISALTAAQPASKIGMVAGQRWPFVDALASLMIVSANDAAYALAERTAGSIPAFVRDETATARQLGMKDSTFADPAGLDDGNAYQGGPLMSAYDIAISTRNALSVPLIAQFAASPTYAFTGPDGFAHTLTNHNKLVSEHLYPGANGFKTGFTDKAQHTLVATANHNGRELIAVILGTYDAYGWAEQLLDAGFAIAPGHGTGETLPPVRVTTYQSRVTQFAAFRKLASAPGNGSTSLAAGTGGSRSTASPATHSSAPSTAARSAAAASRASTFSAARTVAKSGGGGGGPSTSTVVLLVLVALLIVLYVLRVRAVRRARARRLARRRATQSMMRRGGLPVVDGRYRAGTRVGKPVESHVQIRREGEADDARASG